MRIKNKVLNYQLQILSNGVSYSKSLKFVETMKNLFGLLTSFFIFFMYIKYKSFIF